MNKNVYTNELFYREYSLDYKEFTAGEKQSQWPLIRSGVPHE